MNFKVEKMAGFDSLTENDKAELRRFETFLCNRDRLSKDADARLAFMQETGKARITGTLDERIYEVLYDDEQGRASAGGGK